jgi:SAM-dependent methyltransferase
MSVETRYNGKNMRWDGPESRHQLFYRDREQQSAHFDAAVALMPAGWENGTILDVGCGYGDFTSRLPLEYDKKKYLGIDIDREVIQAAKELNHGWRFRWQKKIWPADVIVAIASVSAHIESPIRMMADAWENCGVAAVFTMHDGHCPMETVLSWCPAQPAVIIYGQDVAAWAFYK